MDPLTVFIGSSSEACDRGIVPRLATLLSKHDFKVMPWQDHDGFAPGEFTLDALLAITREIDFALFVFSKDDRAEIRGETHWIPRDNVLLEYGLFTSHLGRRRVAVIQEDGVKLPIDVERDGRCPVLWHRRAPTERHARACGKRPDAAMARARRASARQDASTTASSGSSTR